MPRSSRMRALTRLQIAFTRTSFRLLCLGFTEPCGIENGEKANQTVQRTGASRLAQRPIDHQGRLAPVADLGVRICRMNPIPYAASILWGVVTALGLWLLVIPLSLGEMGGPTNWAVTFLVVAGLMLAVATYTARAKSTLAGVVCSFLFSGPIAGVCYLISHANATVFREHGGQLKFVEFAVVALSAFLMVGVAELRKAPPPPEDGTNKDEF